MSGSSNSPAMIPAREGDARRPAGSGPAVPHGDDRDSHPGTEPVRHSLACHHDSMPETESSAADTSGPWMAVGDISQRPPQVLAVADEWFPAHGGLSAYNRYLCTALAAEGANVYCLVPPATAAEHTDAAGVGVQLVEAATLPGGSAREALIRRPKLPDGVLPDVLIGHGRVTGPIAAAHSDNYPSAARWHFVHMDPDEVEWHKLDREDDTAQRAEDRRATELALAGSASEVFAVGPRLFEWIERDLPLTPGATAPIRLDPGFDVRAASARTPSPGVPQLLLMGRMEDRAVKGLDIAAAGIGTALRLAGADCDDVELLIRGTPVGQAGELRAIVRALAGHSALRVTPRNYSTDFEKINEDLRRANLVLLPSRAEGFGLVGLEAILAGTPVLVSNRSGLGLLLREVLPAEVARQVVVQVHDDESDVPAWGHAIAFVLRNRPAAFATAATIRDTLSTERTWAMAARRAMATMRHPSTRAGVDNADACSS